MEKQKIEVCYSPALFTYYDNPEFDSLFDRLKLLRDSEEKRLIMNKMEEIVHEDLPCSYYC